jgi:hypothetical protein
MNGYRSYRMVESLGGQPCGSGVEAECLDLAHDRSAADVRSGGLSVLHRGQAYSSA